jgi:predicted Zn-dependent protease
MGSLASSLAVCVPLGLLAGCGAAPPSVGDDDPGWVAPPSSQGASARSELLRHSAGVTLSVPTGWSVQSRGNDVELLPPDRAAVVRLTVIDTGQLEVALDAVDRQLDGKLESHDLGSVRTAVVNGMKGRLAAGSGWLKGESIKLRIALVLTPRNQVLVLLAMVRKGASAERQAQIGGLLETLRPAGLTVPRR